MRFPQFTVVKPSDLDVRVPSYYFVADESQFEEFMENSLALKRRDGTIRRLYDYWILGEDDEDPAPRWCIVRDVLHWTQSQARPTELSPVGQLRFGTSTHR